MCLLVVKAITRDFERLGQEPSSLLAFQGLRLARLSCQFIVLTPEVLPDMQVTSAIRYHTSGTFSGLMRRVILPLPHISLLENRLKKSVS